MKYLFKSVLVVLSITVSMPAGAEPTAATQRPRCGGYFLAPGRLSPAVCPYTHHHLKDDGDPAVLFLNFDGGTITRGGDDPDAMTSWIPDYDTVEISPFDHEPYVDEILPGRQAVIDAVTGWARYYYGPFNVIITSVRPTEGPYQMMMVGGHASDISSNPGAMVGVSPFDCGNTSREDVSFCFSEDLYTMADVVTTIVHEAGHSFGLAHVDNVAAVMNPDVTSDPFWDSGSVPDGAACDGSSEQDSFAVLSDSLGEKDDLEAPWVDFLNPGKGATVGQTISVLLNTGDEDSLGRWVELFLDDESKGEKTWPDFAWHLNNLEPGKHTLKAVVRDYGGNSSTTSITVTVDGDCAAAESCTEGKRAVSEVCTKENSCNIGYCVRQTEGDGAWCSMGCTPDTSACAPGMQCVLHEDGINHFCALGPGPVELKTNADDHRLGCSTIPGNKSRAPLLLLALLIGFALTRRFG